MMGEIDEYEDWEEDLDHVSRCARGVRHSDNRGSSLCAIQGNLEDDNKQEWKIRRLPEDKRGNYGGCRRASSRKCPSQNHSSLAAIRLCHRGDADRWRR